MRYEYYFYELYKAQLEMYLQNKGIKYVKYEDDILGGSLKFSVWSTDENYEITLKELRGLRITDPCIYVTYSASELNNAKLLVITPKKQIIDITNNEEAYKFSCEWISSVGIEKAHHMEQIGTFVIRKEPSTKNSTAFWSEDTGFAELFTDKRVYELVKAHSLQGITFKNVMNNNEIYSENIFQMKSPNIIDRDLIEMGHGERKGICHICGKEQFFINNIYQLHLDFSKLEVQSDLYMTESMWGEGIAYPLYIISQRFYQLLKQNKLAGGITVSPVVEVKR